MLWGEGCWCFGDQMQLERNAMPCLHDSRWIKTDELQAGISSSRRFSNKEQVAKIFPLSLYKAMTL